MGARPPSLRLKKKTTTTVFKHLILTCRPSSLFFLSKVKNHKHNGVKPRTSLTNHVLDTNNRAERLRSIVFSHDGKLGVASIVFKWKEKQNINVFLF